MIYLNLAYRNMTRSLRDYAIYFFTVTLAVMIFYSFNSLKDLPVIVEVCRQADVNPGNIAIMLGVVSFLVAFIVAALVLYSNNFIICRRKRELGTYLLLGMSQGTVARMLFIETLAIGMAACILGIGVGILFSGLFSVLLAILLQTGIPSQLFSFSLYSTCLTAILFGLIFFGVGMMSSFMVSRYTLASLLAVNRMNEGYKARNRWVTAIFGCISLGVLVYGYLIAFRAIASPKFSPFDPVFLLVAALMIVGSFGFFYAGIGFVFDILRHLGQFRWRGLNTFTMQQIMKKVNSNTLVLTATNILLAMTITSIVFLVAFQAIFEQEKSEALPYAYAVLSLDPKNAGGFDQAASANPQNPVLNKVAITRYSTDILSSALILPEDLGKDASIITFNDSPCSAVGLSEYNAVRQAKGLSPIQPGAGEIAIQTGSQDHTLSQKIQKAVERGLSVHLSGSTYPVKQVISQSLISALMSSSACMFVVPNAAIGELGLKGATTALMYDYANGRDPIVEKSLKKEIDRVDDGHWISRQEEAATLKMVQTFIMFPGLFIEVILLIACGSVLGLQQLVETVESVHHYQNLHNLGADDRQINRSIFQQITFYFFVPVLLAILHSLVALSAFNKLVGSMIHIQPLGLLLTLGGLLLIYVLYYIITWRNCVRMTLGVEILR